VIKTRKVGLLVALVAMIAVGAVQLTPDPTDDIDGLLRPNNAAVAVRRPRMVKELDLFESNNGCGMNGLPVKNIRNGSNTTLHGPELDA
jgi:hypothetical protein